jgi:hypothetical protein
MQPCFLLSEVQNVNPSNRSSGVVLARWWRLGILALARLAYSDRADGLKSFLGRQDSTIKGKTNEPEHEG